MRSTLFLTMLLLVSLCTYAQHSFQKLDVNTLAGSGANRFTSFKGKTYFVANDSVHGNELWWTDGQAFGMVADITPGAQGSFRDWLTPADQNNFVVAADKLFFPARDATSGAEIYEYDGVNPPRLTAALDADTFGARSNFTELNGMVYFLAIARGVAPWTFPSGLYSFNPTTYQYKLLAAKRFYSLTAFNGKLYTIDYPDPFADTLKFYSYDLVLDTLEVISNKPAINPYVYKGSLYFAMATPPYGAAVFRHNGSTLWRATGTAPGNPRGKFGRFAGIGDKLYFMAADSAAPFADLYSYNVVTEKVTVEQPMASNRAASDLVVYGRKLFLAADRYNNFEKGIYQYDGVNLNLLSFPGQPYSDVPVWMAESNGKLFFAGQEGSTPADREAWVYVDSVALGVNGVQSLSSAAVFPNPATSEAVISIKLKHATTLKVQLADIQGRVVYTVTKQCNDGKHEVIVPIKELPAAVYTYKLTDAAGAMLGMGKLVKE